MLPKAFNSRKMSLSKKLSGIAGSCSDEYLLNIINKICIKPDWPINTNDASLLLNKLEIILNIVESARNNCIDPEIIFKFGLNLCADRILTEGHACFKKIGENIIFYINNKIIPAETALILHSDRNSIIKRYHEITEGRSIDPLSDIDINLLFSFIYSISPGISYSQFWDSIKDIRKAAVPDMPQAFKELTIKTDKVERVIKNRALLLKVSEYRNEIIAARNNRKFITQLLNEIRQINKKTRYALQQKIRDSAESLALLIKNLLKKQIKNYQKEIQEFIEKLLIIYSLKSDPQLLQDIENPDNEISLSAIKNLLEERLFDSLSKITGANFFNEAFENLYNELNINCGDKVLPYMPANVMINLIKQDIKYCSNFLKARKDLIDAAGRTGKKGLNKPFSINIDVSLNCNERPLAVTDLLRIRKRPAVIEVKEGHNNKQYAVKVQTPYFFGGYAVSDKITVKGGLYTLDQRHKTAEKKVDKTDDDFLFDNDIFAFNSQDELLIIELNEINRLITADEELYKKTTKLVQYLEKRILRIINPLSGKTKKMLKIIDKALEYTLHPTGEKTDIKFIPTKDISMLFKSYIGKDCSKSMIWHILHPKSYLYKIVIEKRWCGYLTLLDIENRSGSRALLFDVINLDPKIIADWSDVFDKFINYLKPIAQKEGYRYILIPDNMSHISNSHYISNSIYKKYKKNNKPAEAFGLIPEDNTFQSLNDAFLILWENS